MRATYSITQADVSLSASHPIRIDRLTVTKNVPPHDHDYYEICLVLEGAGEHQTPSYQRTLRRGDILIVPPGGVHALRCQKDLHVVNIYYLAEWLLFDLRSLWDQNGVVSLFLSAALFSASQEPSIPHFRLDEDILALCLDELSHLGNELQRQDPSIVFLKSSLLKLFIRVSRALPADASEELPHRFRTEVERTLNAIEEALMDNRNPSPAMLARQVGLTQDNLSRLFRECTGRTLNDYYQHRRIHLACNLLLNLRTNITEVVYGLGYSDAAHFCRMFKRYTGVSPGKWRRQYLPPFER